MGDRRGFNADGFGIGACGTCWTAFRCEDTDDDLGLARPWLRLTLARVAADNGTELEAALKLPGLIALKGQMVQAEATGVCHSRPTETRSCQMPGRGSGRWRPILPSCAGKRRNGTVNV